jgi:hypothetical protein
MDFPIDKKLQESLVGSSSWRIKEIILARDLALDAEQKGETEALRYLCRAWIVILYAHCDQFLKESVRLYIDFCGNEVDFINEHFLKRKNFDYDRFKLICEFILRTGFDHEVFSAFCRQIIEKRNKIAHGEEFYINATRDCEELHRNTVRFINDFSDHLLDSAKGRIKL